MVFATPLIEKVTCFRYCTDKQVALSLRAKTKDLGKQKFGDSSIDTVNNQGLYFTYLKNRLTI